MRQKSSAQRTAKCVSVDAPTKNAVAFSDEATQHRIVHPPSPNEDGDFVEQPVRKDRGVTKRASDIASTSGKRAKLGPEPVEGDTAVATTVDPKKAKGKAKVNFLVIFDSAIVNSQTSGCVTQGFVRSIVSVDEVKNFNWCQYVVSSPIKAKMKMRSDGDGTFSGPLLFSLLLYLDRFVHHGQRQVPRQFPAFRGWTEKILYARENLEMLSDGFGKGRIEQAMEEKDLVKAKVTTDDYFEDLLESAVDISMLMKSFIAKLNNVPADFRKEAPILACYELGRTVLGRGYPESTGMS